MSERRRFETVVILRDGLPVAVTANESEALAWFQGEHSFSMSHALEHEGYAIVTEGDTVAGRATVTGWMAFQLASTRRGYGVPGALARLAVAIQGTIAAYDQDGAKLADAPAGRAENVDPYTRDALVPMLSAFIELLSNTGAAESAGAFDAIRGDLDAWARAAAERIGADGDAL
jgi:hypothetical protein